MPAESLTSVGETTGVGSIGFWTSTFGIRPSSLLWFLAPIGSNFVGAGWPGEPHPFSVAGFGVGWAELPKQGEVLFVYPPMIVAANQREFVDVGFALCGCVEGHQVVCFAS